MSLTIVNFAGPFSLELADELRERLGAERIIEARAWIHPNESVHQAAEQWLDMNVDWKDTIVNLPLLPIAAAIVTLHLKKLGCTRLLRLKMANISGPTTRKLEFSEVVTI